MEKWNVGKNIWKAKKTSSQFLTPLFHNSSIPSFQIEGRSNVS
jgi:hypothetical protein